MSNKTILVSKNGQKNDSLTNFNKVDMNPHEDFQKRTSTFKRVKPKMMNDYEISFNPFISAASNLIKYIIEVQDKEYIEEDEIRENFITKLNLYDETALKYELDNREILITRYILCTFIDEVMNTLTTQKDASWSSNSLLSIFHNETYGGDNFFHLLEKFLKAPAKYIHILELMYMCIALGFEGKYRVMDKGQIELNNIKDSLFRQIRIVQGRDPFTFYTTQEPAKTKYRLFNKVSIPILFLSILTLLGVIYMSLTFSLHSQDTKFMKMLTTKYQEFNINDLEGKKQ